MPSLAGPVSGTLGRALSTASTGWTPRGWDLTQPDGRFLTTPYISVRYLHKLFELEETTVADWIRRRRLEACHRDLRDPALADQPVSTIAARRGLTSAAHFSRAFRSVYGITPTEYRRLALAPGASAQPATRS
jgi:hypothetical protein